MTRPTKRQLQDFAAAVAKAQAAKPVTDDWLKELAAKRDAHLASL